MHGVRKGRCTLLSSVDEQLLKPRALLLVVHFQSKIINNITANAIPKRTCDSNSCSYCAAAPADAKQIKVEDHQFTSEQQGTVGTNGLSVETQDGLCGGNRTERLPDRATFENEFPRQRQKSEKKDIIGLYCLSSTVRTLVSSGSCLVPAGRAGIVSLEVL
jgi:hypothetical protein